MKSYVYYPIFFFLLTAGLYSCTQTAGKTGGVDLERFPIQVLKPQTVAVFQDYPATLRGEQNIEIRPKIDGFIEEIYVDEGELVKKGQRLFKISAPQYEQEVRTAEAAIESALADVNTARLQYHKTKPLVEDDIISKYELEQAANLLATKEASLQQARAHLANAKTNVGYTFISSPVNGVVGNIPHKTGSLVSSTSPSALTTISNITKIHAYFSFNERQFLDFMNADEASALEEKIKEFPAVKLILANGMEYRTLGKIETVGGVINTETGSINLRATFPNPSLLIKSGASAKLRIPIQLANAITVPANATRDIQSKLFVYTVDKNGLVKSREVEIMDYALESRYIIKSGLTEGDRIVLEGISTLQDNMQVTPDLKN